MLRWMQFCVVLALLSAVAPLPSPAVACSLCDASVRNRNTLREELNQAKVVLYGTLANPTFTKRPGALPGAGTTEFHLIRPIVDDPIRGGRKTIEIANFLPVPDPAQPPKFVAFCDMKNGQLDVFHGRFVKTDALLSYLAGIYAVKAKDRTQQLQFFFQYLDHDDPVVSDDAFLEFARLSDVEVGSIAKHLAPEKLRDLLKNPRTPPERLGLVAFLLGASGNDKQNAQILRQMLEQPNERNANALDGLLSGYINLQPREGWDMAARILGDAKRPTTQRYAVVRTLSFYHAWKPAEHKLEITRCLTVMLGDRDFADVAIEDLRQWKTWDYTKQVLAHYGQPPDFSPLTRRTVIRYALCCPQPEAKQFIAAVRQREPDLVREQEEDLQFEKGK